MIGKCSQGCLSTGIKRNVCDAVNGFGAVRIAFYFDNGIFMVSAAVDTDYVVVSGVGNGDASHTAVRRTVVDIIFYSIYSFGVIIINTLCNFFINCNVYIAFTACSDPIVIRFANLASFNADNLVKFLIFNISVYGYISGSFVAGIVTVMHTDTRTVYGYVSNRTFSVGIISSQIITIYSNGSADTN